MASDFDPILVTGAAGIHRLSRGAAAARAGRPSSGSTISTPITIRR